MHQGQCGVHREGRVSVGDGGAQAGLVECRKPHVLRRVDDTMVFDKHTYAKADTYTIKATGYGCGLSKKGVTTTTAVKVP